MKTKTFIKLGGCILAIFATFQVISNVHDTGVDMRTGSSSILSNTDMNSRNINKYQLDNNANDNDNIKNNNSTIGQNQQNNPEKMSKPLIFVDLSNLRNAHRDSTSIISDKMKKAAVSSNEKYFKISVNDSPSKKAIKSILNLNGNISSLHDNNDTSAEKRKKKIEEIKSLSRTFFSSGFGLKPLITKDGDKGWIDNGVIYRKIKKDNSEIEEKYPAPRLVDYEPFVPFNETMFFTGPKPGSQRPQPNLDMASGLYKKKIIMWYTPARYTAPSDKPEPLRFCPDFPCLMTTNKKYFKESSLVVFNGQLVGTRPPTRTSPNQIFMFQNQEPPLQMFFKNAHFHEPDWHDAFNWTMTYRSDSTIPSYYGIVRKHPNPPEKNYDQILSQKNGTVAWMVSHCGSPSRRDKYVDELKKYVDVDIYGSCGRFKCPRQNDEKCNSDIAKRYKFYLGFENALCPEYVSEKFFRFMSLDIVTVSRAMKGNLDAHAVPGTYIDTNDFASPKDLGTFLTYLDHNDEAYINILREKDKYMYLFEEYAIRGEDRSVKYIHYHYEAVPFCQACQRLWNLKENAEERIRDIQEWFDKELCVEPYDL